MAKRTPLKSQTAAMVHRLAEDLTLAAREAAQDLIAEAQTPGPSATNPYSTGPGRLPVATGYLRASLVAAPGGQAPLETERTGPGPFFTNGGAVVLALATWKIGERLGLYWTANYAKFVEHRTGFVRLAVQNWPQIYAAAMQRVQAARRAAQ